MNRLAGSLHVEKGAEVNERGAGVGGVEQQSRTVVEYGDTLTTKERQLKYFSSFRSQTAAEESTRAKPQRLTAPAASDSANFMRPLESCVIAQGRAKNGHHQQQQPQQQPPALSSSMLWVMQTQLLESEREERGVPNAEVESLWRRGLRGGGELLSARTVPAPPAAAA